jgi:urease beta subunit
VSQPKKIPGEVLAQNREILLNKGRTCVEVTVANTGDRPIQVGSHFHFFEVNRLLAFDRRKAFGRRLDIPSGTSVRFEPGETKTVALTELGGTKTFLGLNGLSRGNDVEQSLLVATEKGFVREGE